MSERNDRSYSREMMLTGKENENIIMAELEKQYGPLNDLRSDLSCQAMDIDCVAINTGESFELKSDRWVAKDGNLLVEHFRINHTIPTPSFYIGWAWRSGAKTLITRNPNTGDAFILDFATMRKTISGLVLDRGRKRLVEGKDYLWLDRDENDELLSIPQLIIPNDILVDQIPTDKIKTTFNLLFPMHYFEYKHVVIPTPPKKIGT